MMLRRYHEKEEMVEKPKQDLSKLTVAELKGMARDKEVVGFSSMNKSELVDILEVD